MDRDAIQQIAADWPDAFAQADTQLGWAKDADLSTEPAFLTDTKSKDGDDYKAGAVRVSIETESEVTDEMVDKLYDAVVADRTLGGRAKQATFERPTGSAEVGTLVIVPLQGKQVRRSGRLRALGRCELIGSHRWTTLQPLTRPHRGWRFRPTDMVRYRRPARGGNSRHEHPPGEYAGSPPGQRPKAGPG